MPVTPNMKIAEVLRLYPQLLDVLVSQSPHFSRLRNPILRRIQSRLVTVSQAAAIAGLESAVLIRNLNGAIGEECTSPVGPVEVVSKDGTPSPSWLESAPVMATVDVRDAPLRNGEPFNAIMKAAAQVRDGGMLLLRSSFEPLPLYEVLGKRGFLSWARRFAADNWEVFFFRSATSMGNVAEENASPSAGHVDVEPTASMVIDVRELVPPQPLMRIMDALAQLQPGQTLLVHHVRRPVYLYPRLAEQGCTHVTREVALGCVEILIRKGR